MAMEANAPFLWGSGGRRLTPEEILMERKASSALGSEAMSTAPVGHWSQGLNRVLQGLMAGYDGYSADQASKQNGTESAAVIQALLGGATPAATPTVAAPTGAPMAASPMGAVGVPAGRDEFVNSIMPMAQEASARTGLDPRLIVAQAALESGWGKSAPGNNLFGIKSHGMPGGNTMATTEVVNGQPVAVQDSFRAYASPADSVKGYADFMTQNPRYEPVRAAQGLEAQVAALGKSGYATDPAYAQKVMQIAQGLPAPAGGAPVPAASGAAARPAINPAIVQAISSPYMSDSAKKIGTMLFQNNLEQQQKAADPLRALQIQKAQGDIAAMPLDLRGKQLSNTKAEAELSSIPLELRSKQLANTKAERELQGEGAMPLSKDERASYGIPDGQPAYKTRSGEIKFGPAGTKITNVNGDAETSFSKEAGKVTANRFNDLVADGQKSKQMMSDMTTLLDLGKGIGTGKGAQLKAVLGPYAQAAGIDVTGLPDIQAYEAIVNRVAPSLRVAGSGAQSDYELKNFLKSIPSLGNTQEGNELATAVMTGLTQNKVQAAEISSRALAGEITRTEAEKQLRELPDPMKPYTDYKQRKSNVDDLLKKYGGK